MKIEGTRTVIVGIDARPKYIASVFLKLEDSQILLNVGQLTKNHYVLLFKDKYCHDSELPSSP